MEKKSNMQNVSFRNVDEFLEYLPEDQLKITEVLRNLVLSCIPDAKEWLAYNVPYYKRHLSICFIWPGAIDWNGVTRKGVRFGFNKGYLLNDESNYLDKGTRKQVYWRDFYSLKEIDADLLKSYLFEALIIDEEEYKAKQKTKKKPNIKD